MRKMLVMLALLGAGCATTAGGGGGAPVHQADHRLPESRSIDSDAERALFDDAMRHASLGEVARTSGNLDQARAEWTAAGTQFRELGEKYRSSEFRLVYLTYGARLTYQGGDYEGSIRAAEALRADPGAEPRSKASALQLRGIALQALTTAEVKAGRLEPLRIVGADKRKGQEPKPRPLPDGWRRLVGAADDYVAVYKEDRSSTAQQVASSLAIHAAQVQFSFDNMEEASRRLLATAEQFPSSAYFEDSVSLYLQTFLVRRDEAGYAAAIDKVRPLVAAEAKRSAEAAAQKPGDADLKARAEALAKQEEDLSRQRQGVGFRVAGALLAESQRLEGEAGRQKAVEAAGAFERFAAENAGHPEAASALYNAAIAWAKAKEPKKALAAREAVVAKYGDSRIAPKALLAVASDLSAAGDHAGAAQRYAQYLDRYGAAEDRCLAAQNVGAELDAAKQPNDAARRYVDFGADPKCSKEDPNNAAKVLYRAAMLWTKAGKKAEASEALRALVAVPGVTDPVAKSYIDDARTRMKK